MKKLCKNEFNCGSSNIQTFLTGNVCFKKLSCVTTRYVFKYKSAVVPNWHLRKSKRYRSSLFRSNWFLRKTRRFSSVTSSAEALPLASFCGKLKLCGAGGVKTWEETEGLQGVRPRCKQKFFWRVPFKNLVRRSAVLSRVPINEMILLPNENILANP